MGQDAWAWLVWPLAGEKVRGDGESENARGREGREGPGLDASGESEGRSSQSALDRDPEGERHQCKPLAARGSS